MLADNSTLLEDSVGPHNKLFTVMNNDFFVPIQETAHFEAVRALEQDQAKQVMTSPNHYSHDLIPYHAITL